MSRSAYRFVLVGIALIVPGLLWGQSAELADRQGGPGSAPEPAFVVRGPAPPDLPEMVRRDDAGGATMRATRLTEPLEFDGRLDDAIYERVPGVSGFIQALPLEGEPATEDTEVWVFFDDEAVYVAGRNWDSQPDRMVATEMRRDNFGIFNNENLAVILDTFYDRRNAFFFYLNPIGGFFDGLIVDERSVNRDWTAVWDSRAARFENGWTMEMRIPFKTLRYVRGGPQVWGINFRRVVRWKNEMSYLTQVPAALGPRGITKISSAGTLVGLEAPASSRTIEVKPYLIGDAAGARIESGALDRDFGGDFGLDAKVGITSGLTADLTYNTDFAQVEADAQQINLTRFSLFFPEKREFFLEGQGIFDFGTSSRGAPPGSTRSFGPPSSTPVLFFSRRIGIEAGQAVPITGGARVTGKLGDYNIGALAIRSGESTVRRVSGNGFFGVPIEAGHPEPQHGRRDGDVPLAHREWPGAELRLRDGCRVWLLRTSGHPQLRGLDAERTRGRDRAELSRPGGLQRRPLRAPGRAPGGRGRIRSGDRVHAPPGLPAELRRGPVQSPAAFDFLAPQGRLDGKRGLHDG